MPQRAHCDAASQVEIAFTGDVVNVTARTMAQNNIEPAIARNHVLLEQVLNRRHIVSNERRWCWNNLVHRSQFTGTGEQFNLKPEGEKRNIGRPPAYIHDFTASVRGG